MKLTCSCGATGEFLDSISGGVDAANWLGRHANCAALSAERARLAERVAELESVAHAVLQHATVEISGELLAMASAAVAKEKSR